MALDQDLKKHQIAVSRLASRQRKLIEDELQQLRRQANIEIISGTAGKQLKQNLRTASQGFVDRSLGSLMQVAEKESSYIAKKLGVDMLGREVLQTKILTENMRLNLGSQEKSRKSLETAFNQFGRRKADEIAQIIRDGQAMGLPSIDIMKNVDERINGRHTAQARVLSDTSTLYTSNVAQRETIKQSTQKVVFTLGDSADHTDVCLGLDGQIFDATDAPTPPLHWGCNSYLVPIEDTEE